MSLSEVCARAFSFNSTSFSGYRPAQREWARTGLIGPIPCKVPSLPNPMMVFGFVKWTANRKTE